MVALNDAQPDLLLALARHPVDHSWWFALQGGGRLAYGPLTSSWDLPALGDLAPYLPRMLGRSLIVAVPAKHAEELESRLRRSPLLVGASIRLHAVVDAGIAQTLAYSLETSDTRGFPGRSAVSSREVLASRFPGIDIGSIEDGSLQAIAMLIAGEEAHSRWEGRFGSLSVQGTAVREGGYSSAERGPETSEHVRRSAGAAQEAPLRRDRPRRCNGSTDFVTLAELAQILGIERTTVYRMSQRGDFPTHRVGRQIRVRRQDVEEFLTQQRVPSSKEMALARRGKITVLRKIGIEDDEQRGRDLADKLGL